MADLGTGERLELRAIHDRFFVRKVVWRLGTVGGSSCCSSAPDC